MKKLVMMLLCALVAICTLTTLVACDKTPSEPETLATPSNVQISDTGLITWNAVENATSYVVTINSENNSVSGTSFQVLSTLNDFYYSVYAKADGYKDSLPSETKFFEGNNDPPIPPAPTVAVAIQGGSEIKSGQSITLKATVDGKQADSSAVSWSVEQGQEYVSVDQTGKVTANEVDGEKQIVIKATSAANAQCFAQKVLTVVTRPELTQEMLDAIETEKVGFEGFLSINLYTIGLFSKPYRTISMTIKTAMDGTNWYAEYENSSTNLTTSLYFKNHEGVACQVGVSFMNDEQYIPMVDGEGMNVSWTDSGLYNSLGGLSVDDFEFDEIKWRWMYKGADSAFLKRVIASANPYDFDINNFGLIIDEGEVAGIYAISNDDYTVLEGYKAIQELFVAINIGNTVDVPTISKFSHDPQYDQLYENLQTAIDNMRELDSYTLDFKEITASYLTSGYTQSGYRETITQTNCYFQPFTVSYGDNQHEIHTFVENSAYGFKKINDTLYNAYSETKPSEYSATRAYATTFDNAKPTFAMSSEIFRSYFEDEETGSITYYVDDVMCGAASTFYYGMGNDINLYGIFATKGYTSQDSSFTPYLTVKDGYITNAGFYFYLGSIYGVVEIEYSGFNASTLPEGVEVEFETRQVPTSWSQLTIQVSNDSSSTSEDVETNALDYLKEFYGNENIDQEMPFFGVPLGDTYGFGLSTYHIPVGTSVAKPSIVFYYDVPLGIDYTIDEPLRKVKEYLLSLGFEKNAYDEFRKGDICVAPMDSSLDLVIYVWKA